MLSIKTLLFILPLSAVAQIILSPVSCTLVCIERSLSATTCEKAQSGISDPSVIPCLCEDEEFMRETVNCLVNSGECRNVKDQQDSYKYAFGLCESNGVNLPGNAPSDLPSAFGISSTIADSVFVSKAPVTTVSQSSATPEVLTVEETVTTMIAVPTSIACEPFHAVNATYVVVNNVTQTIGASPTRGNCGNSTMTVPFTTTKKSTKTTTPEISPMAPSSTGEAPLSTSTGTSGAQGPTTQSGFVLALLGLLMWLV